jgi:hypothetical protein
MNSTGSAAEVIYCSFIDQKMAVRFYLKAILAFIFRTRGEKKALGTKRIAYRITPTKVGSRIYVHASL